MLESLTVAAHLRSLRASAAGRKENPRHVKELIETESNSRLFHFYLYIHVAFIN